MDKDTIENIVVNGAAISVSLTDVETWLRITALILGIAFTIYKFIKLKNESRFN